MKITLGDNFRVVFAYKYYSIQKFYIVYRKLRDSRVVHNRLTNEKVIKYVKLKKRLVAKKFNTLGANKQHIFHQ